MLRMNSRKVFVAFFSLVVLASGLCQTASLAEQEDEYVFYGYAPATVKPVFFAKANGPEHKYVGSSPQLTIVGIHDGTRVEVYNLADKGVISSFTVNEMEFRRIPLANETYFKVLSDKLVSALLSGGGWRQSDGTVIHGASTFYPSIDGGYIGDEFIFTPVNSTWYPGPYAHESGMLHIFFIEDARVTIQDAEGNVIDELEGALGETKTTYLRRPPGEADFLALEAYTVVSTGRIMLAGVADNSFLYLPCLTGGFVGRHFLGALISGATTSIVVVALEDAEVAIYDLRRPSWHITLSGPDAKMSLSAGDWENTTMSAGIPMRIDSTGDISVLVGKGGGEWGHGWGEPPLDNNIERIGDDISFVVVRPDQEFGFFVPSEAVLFAHEESIIDVDGAMVTVRKDEYLRLAQGVHTVEANAPVTIEILGQGQVWEFPADIPNPIVYEHYDNYASYLVSYQGFTENYPEPPAVGGLGEITLYIGIGVAVPILLAILILIRKRGKKRKD